MLHFLKNLLQLMLSPVHAWDDIAKEDESPERLTSSGLFPLMAVMLITALVNGFLTVGKFDLVRQLQLALTQFVALFIALYAGRTMMESFLPKYNNSGETDPIGAATVAIYTTGIMVVLQILENLIPVELIVMKFLPVFAALILWKAERYLDLEPERAGYFMLMAIVSLIGPVIVINLVMSWLMI